MTLTPHRGRAAAHAGSPASATKCYVALMKSAYSTNIKERQGSQRWRSSTSRAGSSSRASPCRWHLASMLGLVVVVLERVGLENLRPGDMFISNDPFVGRRIRIRPIVALVAPVYYGDRACLLRCLTLPHHADIGGMAPGSMAGGMTEVYQEGSAHPADPSDEGRQDRRGSSFDLILHATFAFPRNGGATYLAQVAANRLG